MYLIELSPWFAYTYQLRKKLSLIIKIYFTYILGMGVGEGPLNIRIKRRRKGKLYSCAYHDFTAGSSFGGLVCHQTSWSAMMFMDWMKNSWKRFPSLCLLWYSSIPSLHRCSFHKSSFSLNSNALNMIAAFFFGFVFNPIHNSWMK